MNRTVCAEEVNLEAEASRPSPLTELVRGSDQLLIAQMEPLVRAHDVALDLACVERIDAAGIAALIALYRMAREAGHGFSISKASPRVAEMLAIVGLDEILLSEKAHQNVNCRAEVLHADLARNAA